MDFWFPAFGESARPQGEKSIARYDTRRGGGVLAGSENTVHRIN